jgi:hypothetical protein
MGKGRTTINQPDPIDPGQSAGEFLFGKDFKSYGGFTDPRLQERLIGAERTYRPEYAALELADINTFAFGLGERRAGEGYEAQQAKVDQLESQLANIKPKLAPSRKTGRAAIMAGLGAGALGSKKFEGRDNPEYIKLQRQLDVERRKLRDLAPRREQAGLFDLLEEGGRRSADIQRESLQAQREADVGALQEFAPQVVEAYRAADPYSTMLAEQTQRRAMGQLTPDEERDIQQQARQAAAARGRTGASAEFGEVLARRQFTDQYTQPAFQMNRALAGDVGMAILGRPSSALSMGGNILGQAQGQAAQPIWPQLFDPNVGINMALQQRSQDMSLLGAQAQADATRSSGLMQGLGTIGAAMITGGGCWVAREVYGIENPRWLAFRHWLFTESPSWFKNLYIKHGERFAKFISNKPFIKNIIRKWMDTKIK